MKDLITTIPKAFLSLFYIDSARKILKLFYLERFLDSPDTSSCICSLTWGITDWQNATLLIYNPWNVKDMTDFNTISSKRGINIYQYKEFY